MYRAGVPAEGEVIMVSFINAFLSYLLLLFVIVILGAVAVTVGITLRKRKNAQMVCEEQAGTTETTDAQ